MSRKYRNMLPVCLSFLLLLSACLPGASPADSASNRGRYVEEEAVLSGDPWGINGISQLPDGSYRMLVFQASERVGAGARGEYRVLNSADGGRTWADNTPQWLGSFDTERYAISDAVFLSGGEWFLLTTERSESGFADQVFRCDEDGAELLDYELRSAMDYDGSGYHTLLAVGENLITGTDYKAFSFEAASGKKQLEFPVDNTVVWGSFAAYGQSLAIGQHNRIDLFDLRTGELQGELVLNQMPVAAGEEGYSNSPEDLTAMTFAEDGAALYYCNASGLYRALVDGSVTERLMDSSLTSLGMPTIYLQYLFRNDDGSFLAVCMEQDMGQRLFRYTFDPDVPTMPDKELKLYSLYENKTLRQAIGSFQLAMADVKVDYQVGITGENSVTPSDALRSLSTELLAGKGPDVLALDGMPLESYREKGILADLSDLVDERIAAGELIAPVAGALRDGDALYAIPARYTVPVVHGREIGSVRDFASLAQWMESREKRFDYDASIFLDQYYAVLSPQWFREDGSLDRGAFSQDLQRVASMLTAGEMAMYRTSMTLSSGALELKGGLLPVNLGWLQSFTEIAAPYSEIAESGGGEVRLLPQEGIFLPLTVLGLNAASAQQPLAKAFIEHTLSVEVLEYDFQDGLPVNTEALHIRARNNGQESVGKWGFTAVNEETGEYETIFLDVVMPDQAVVEEWLQALQSIEAFSLENAVVKAMIIEETAAFFAGDKSLDDTVQDLAAKLDLYLME